MMFHKYVGWARSAFAALVAGSRSIPMGDNGALIRELAARVGQATDR